jgi:hypothetical protein
MTNLRRLTTMLVLAGSVGSVGCGQGSSNGAHPGGSSGNTSGKSGNGGGSGNASGTSGGSSGGGSGSTSGTGAPAASPDGGGIMPGTVTATSTPYDLKTATDATRKVKNLLVGLAPTDAEIASVQSMGAAGLQQLIITWTTDSSTLPFFQNKMMVFFRNTFQQIGFTPTVDFMPQLLENGGFDFGPFGVSAVGDDAFARLVQNLQDEFALTAWTLVQEGHPLLETLTTQQYMMTTGLKSLYLQIEMPNDQPYSFTKGTKLQWKIDYSGNPIALEDAINPSSANYMVFSDEPPATMGSFFGGGSSFPTCRGGTTDNEAGAPITQGQFSGYAQLFQRMLGFTPRYPFAATPECWEHPSKPYFTDQDMSDWQWVNVRALNAGEAYVQPYDLPTLRTATELALALPRIGFYTTPAFLALWNTNDSNQHRVTANQTLLAALGASFTSANVIVPISEQGLDSDHAVTGSQCYVCHSGLDPLRQFWANQFDFNDRNDWITMSFTGAAPNPKPTMTGGTLAFDSVNMTGSSILDLGTLLASSNDSDPTTPLNSFAQGITQKLCYYANSTSCDPTDSEFRRVAFVFQNSNFNFPALVKEFFSSPLVTGAGATMDAGATLPDGAPPPGLVAVSIARRDHFCQALSNRLGVTDLCSLAVPLPSTAQTTTSTIAGSVVADAFSRGSEIPVTPSDPNLFFRAAVEELCENLAPLVVDATANTVYSSANAATAIPDMVQKIMGYTPNDPHYAQALQILQAHSTSVSQAQGGTATVALRSTFVLACESPTSVSIGL